MFRLSMLIGSAFGAIAVLSTAVEVALAVEVVMVVLMCIQLVSPETRRRSCPQFA